MNKDTKAVMNARQFYAGAYADYIKNGNLEEATRQVAHEIYVNRGTAPGTQQEDWAEAEKITALWPHTITDASQAHLFDKALAKTRLWLKELELELGMSNPNEAWRALRAVLHAVRDRLPVQECAELASQLPVMIAGMYYTGWTPADKPLKTRNLDEFMDTVADKLPKGLDPLRVTRGVLRVLERHVSAGEISDVRRNFPEHLRGLWSEAPAARR